MNLYLSSYLIGDHADRLLERVGGQGARLAVITNARDNLPSCDQLAIRGSASSIDQYFASYGFDPSLVDLRDYFGRREALRVVLLQHKVIWAIGGSAFLLRRAMRDSGFDDLIRELLGQGIVYAGWSAGACVAGDSLRAVGQMDDPEVSAPGYLTTDMIWDGLGLVPFTILPHYDAEDTGASSAAAAAAWAVDHQIDHRTLADGDALLVIDNGEPMLLPRAR